jgi:hypothetical protein
LYHTGGDVTRLCALALASALLLPAVAHGYTFATDEEGNPLTWQEDGPVRFSLHYQGTGDLPGWLVQATSRNAFATWAEVGDADIEFEEGFIYGGVPCPHAIPNTDADLIQEMCGGEVPTWDYISALYFMEVAWPFGTEVIALTTLSWGEGARLLDADISFNALDYTWTVDDSDVQVDYESIAAHEIGHFVGLDHSDVAGAIMRIDYDQGDVVRGLGEDDIAGLADIYPCASPPCLGDVGHIDPSSCSAIAGRGVGGLLTLSLLLVVAGVVRRSRRSEAAQVPLALLLGGIVLAAPSAVTSSTVRALSVDDLTAQADRVVLARVASVQPYADRLVRSRIELDVLEDWLGEGPERVSLDQPGGVLPDRGTKVFGMPGFEAGEQVVVFLADDSPLGTRVLGLAQGKFRVLDDGRLQRDRSGLRLARLGDGPPVPLIAPARVELLRARVQR